MSRTVRDATLDVLRRRGLTTLFANPGSTEVPFLVDLPADLAFVLALHEGAVVGAATGYALGRRAPALALLHTTAGLGNAVGALATARVNRAPLVVLVGQQDRRHLAFEPFLAGRLEGLAGSYPVSLEQPARAQDVPAALERAVHRAETARGPALVVVPMDDWSADAPAPGESAAAGRVARAAAADPEQVEALAELLDAARSPALVTGADADEPPAWEALVALAERLRCPVFQESFGGRAGFPQDHPLFARHLPADRTRLRDLLGSHDLVVAFGAPAFRQSPYAPGALVPEGTRVAVVVHDPEEAHRSAAELALVAPVAAVAAELARRVRPRDAAPPAHARPEPPAPAEPLTTAHVFSALAERLPPDAVLVEECPSSRPELERRVPARAPLGFVSAAMGGLGFALPAAVGLRLALPERPVVAVVGDGSAMYQPQALWTAAHYGVGALFLVLANGGYAIMDHLARHRGGAGPWPSFDLDVAGVARALGCEARRLETHDDLLAGLDDALADAAGRAEPLLLEVAVVPDAEFAP